MIKVFEAFAGYGSQRMALEKIGIPYEIVGISEIDKDALLSYAAIHSDFLKEKNNINNSLNVSEEKMYSYLEKINVPLNSKNFQNMARKLRGENLKQFYYANKIIKNFGDITKIDPKELPDFDFFTYSFPCQDISIAGYQNGLTKNSGTRSSLLWECCKIIEEKRPSILMLENVKNLVGKKHIKNFNNFLVYLESLGYKNNWKILNAKDFEIPQNRERVFCVSFLDKNNNFNFPESKDLKLGIYDLLEKEVHKKFYLKKMQTTTKPIKQNTIYCIDANYWKGTTLESFQKKHRRQLVSGEKNPSGLYPVRRLTPLETWRFMGCSDKNFLKASQVISNTSLYRLAGNSIVVQVLEAIFKEIFKINLLLENEKEN